MVMTVQGPEAMDPARSPETARSATAVMEVAGVQWASPKSVAEAVLSRRPGVLAVTANPVAQTATVTFDPDVTSVAELARSVRHCGFHCAGRSVPEHVCDPLTEPVPSCPAKLGCAQGDGGRTPRPRGGDDWRLAGADGPRRSAPTWSRW